MTRWSTIKQTWTATAENGGTRYTAPDGSTTVWVGPGTIIVNNASIGIDAYVSIDAYVDPDACVGPRAYVGYGASIGDGATVGHGAIVPASEPPTDATPEEGERA